MQITSCARIRLVRKDKVLSQEAFAQSIGVSRGYLNDIERGRQLPSYNVINSLSEVHSVSIDWLLTGEGGMYRDARPQPDTRLSALAALMEGLTESQQQDVVREIEEKQRINRLAEAVEELKQQVAQGQSSSEKTGTA